MPSRSLRTTTAHYGGALKGYCSLDEQLQESVQAGKKIDPNAYGAMQRARASRGNSVVLHELYFGGLVRQTPDPPQEGGGPSRSGSGHWMKWADDLQSSANAAAGWAMLAYHPVSRKLYNVVSDEHAMELLWMGTPLVVIDVYEHAFYIDYHNRKSEYVQKFMDHIDWNEVGARYRMVASE